ncbi:MAG: hypothetical protein ACKOCJ_05580 [Burkholderiaceae bacterium]
MYFERLREQQADYWLRADRTLNFLLLALLVVPVYRVWTLALVPWYRNPVLLGLFVITAILVGEAISLAWRRRR